MFHIMQQLSFDDMADCSRNDANWLSREAPFALKTHPFITTFFHIMSNQINLYLISKTDRGSQENLVRNSLTKAGSSRCNSTALNYIVNAKIEVKSNTSAASAELTHMAQSTISYIQTQAVRGKKRWEKEHNRAEMPQHKQTQTRVYKYVVTKEIETQYNR